MPESTLHFQIEKWNGRQILSILKYLGRDWFSEKINLLTNDMKLWMHPKIYFVSMTYISSFNLIQIW